MSDPRRSRISELAESQRGVAGAVARFNESVASLGTPDLSGTRAQPENKAGGIAGGKNADKPRRRKQQSSLPVRGGSREMKAYAVTEDELETLGLLSIGSTVAFSLASFLGAFWLSVRTSIALSTGVKSEVVSYWNGLSTGAGIAAGVLVLVGGVFIYRGHSKIGRIKAGTDHG